MTGYGYRRFLIRDATVGIEFPDTIDEMVSTRWVDRYFETHGGLTLATADFIRACQRSVTISPMTQIQNRQTDLSTNHTKGKKKEF